MSIYFQPYLLYILISYIATPTFELLKVARVRARAHQRLPGMLCTITAPYYEAPITLHTHRFNEREQLFPKPNRYAVSGGLRKVRI